VIKEVVQRLARSAGVSITRFPPPESLAFHLQRLFQTLSVNLVFDVGANEGRYVDLLRRIVRYPGRVVSFEPGSESYAALVARWGSDPRWTGRRLALGESSGEAQLHRFARSTFDSFRTPSDYGIDRFSLQTRPRGVEHVQVRTIVDVFDEVARDLEDPRVHLKIDTQGSDLEVIRGAREVLDQVVSIQIEISLKPIYEGQPGWLDTLNELEGLGYEVTGMFPISRDVDGLAVIEFDCVLRRRAA